MSYQEIFSSRVLKLRKEKGIKSKQIVNILKIKQPSFSAYETGKAFPNSHNLIKLAEYFDVSIDYLVGRTDKPNINN